MGLRGMHPGFGCFCQGGGQGYKQTGTKENQKQTKISQRTFLDDDDDDDDDDADAGADDAYDDEDDEDQDDHDDDDKDR